MRRGNNWMSGTESGSGQLPCQADPGQLPREKGSIKGQLGQGREGLRF